MRTPAFRVEASGSDVTGLVARHLAELRVTLTSDRASDTVEIDLSDDRHALAIPTAERELRVWLGYEDAGLVPMGVYYHDESEMVLAPSLLTVRATAADLRRRSALKAPRRRAWDNVQLRDLVRAIATEHGYAARVAPDLADVAIAHIDQTAESDLHLLRRLARQYDATVKAAGGYLIFAPRGRGLSAGTDAPLPVVTYAPREREGGDQAVLSARYTVRGRPRYDAVVASYQDVEQGGQRDVKVRLRRRRRDAGGDDGDVRAVVAGYHDNNDVAEHLEHENDLLPTFIVREPLPDRAQAVAAATARLLRFARQKEEVELSVPGRPEVVSETVVQLIGWPTAGTSRWTVLRAEHTLGPRQGFISSIVAEPAYQPYHASRRPGYATEVTSVDVEK